MEVNLTTPELPENSDCLPETLVDSSEATNPENAPVEESPIPPMEPFKKPKLLIGPRRGKVGQLRVTAFETPTVTTPVEKPPSCDETPAAEPEKVVAANAPLPLPYNEPSWGGIPPVKYQVEVLKSGVILETTNLSKKSFHVVGRLPTCDIALAHPTISRYHAVFQYKAEPHEKTARGLYVYDLGSTHGTFWNGFRIKPKTYVRLHGGHMLKFGCSQRKFIIQTPADEEEEESEHSVTELKEMRRQELLTREKEERERREAAEEAERLQKEREEQEGVSWGIPEDAVEEEDEADLSENPFALTGNEELFLDDPKKTLRGWFEREGFDLQYQTEEKGVGQFLCWVELPIDPSGRSVRAEALVKGKKKESVVQCALEACRILDRQGLLRQATHEGRKRKTRNWEDEDFYDSDEDNFLDRTGAVERKREARMRSAGKLGDKAENYSSLVEKHGEVVAEMTKIEATLENHRKTKAAMADNSGEDELDVFMDNLSSALLNKADLTRLKVQLSSLRKEEESLRKLVNITRPANLPALNVKSEEASKPVAIAKNQEIEEEKEEEERPQKVRYGLIKSDEAPEPEEKAPVVELETEKVEKIADEGKDKVKEIERRKKKNLKRQQSRAEKAAKELQKGYDEIAHKEDYSMWLPPSDQKGDGKTSLNDKYGY